MNRRSPDRSSQHVFPPGVLDELAPLAKADNWHALLAVCTGYAIVAAAVALGTSNPWLYPLAVVVIGSRQRAFTTLLHDAAHGRAAKSRWLNRLVGSQLSGYLIFQTFRPYRQSHVIYHHGHLGEQALDPDFQFYLDSGLYDGMTRSQFLVRHVLATLLMLNVLGYLCYVVKHRLISLTRSRMEMVSFAVFWVGMLALIHALNAWDLFLLYWIVPYVTAFLIIGRFIEIAEHYPLLPRHGATNVMQSTRNRFSHPVEALFFSMHNENFHLVHHLRPDIPFWNMARAHRAMLGCSSYVQVNREFGGIFMSDNGNPALFPALVSGKIPLPLEIDMPPVDLNPS